MFCFLNLLFFRSDWSETGFALFFIRRKKRSQKQNILILQTVVFICRLLSNNQITIIHFNSRFTFENNNNNDNQQ